MGDPSNRPRQSTTSAWFCSDCRSLHCGVADLAVCISFGGHHGVSLILGKIGPKMPQPGDRCKAFFSA